MKFDEGTQVNHGGRTWTKPDVSEIGHLHTEPVNNLSVQLQLPRAPKLFITKPDAELVSLGRAKQEHQDEVLALPLPWK